MHMIQKKRSGKASVLPERPTLPSLEEIETDIRNSPDDDIVFTSGEKIDDVDLNLQMSVNDSDSEDQLPKPDEKQMAKVEEQYSKVLKFVKLHKGLIEGQKELTEMSQGLADTCEIVHAERKELEHKLNQQQKLFKDFSDS